MSKDYVINGKKVIGWYTRGGARIPMFEDTPKRSEKAKNTKYELEQLKADYEHKQDKFEYYKFNAPDDEDRIKYKKLRDEAYDKYVKAQRQYDEQSISQNETLKNWERRKGQQSRYLKNKEKDNSDFENKYLKAHKEPSIENSKEYENFSKEYASKYSDKERTKMFDKSQESRRREIEGDNLNDKFKNKTPKQKAREIDKANGKKDYSSMTRKELAEAIVDDQIKRGIVKKESRELQINARLKGIGSAKPMSKQDLLGYFKSKK